MTIFAVDDEPNALMVLRRAIGEAAPHAGLLSFDSADAALSAVEEQKPDIAFCDIEMPGVSGLEFAVRLKSASPDTRVVFVTAFPQYALDAFKVRAQGYILKPLTAEQVREELSLLPAPPPPPRAGGQTARSVLW